ncbi:glycosyltransferase 87 family protein [Nocardioides humi]|uniref:glycosyltransferase 87 family protein n=1 Tax=Nocardioides humi TaxID=449461 RepID=UPI00112B37ED|nr:glycosyltransferase 87 family protein [Nocardioides humi]
MSGPFESGPVVPGAVPDRVRLWAWWGLTRLVLVVLLLTAESGSITDLNYYRASLDDLGAEGVGGTLAEYPVPAFLALAAPYALMAAIGATGEYRLLLIVLLLLLDAAFHRALLRRGSVPAAWMWVAAAPALGAVTYARFDLLPGVLVGLALLRLVDAPRRAAVLAVLATGLKYSPALMLPALAAPAATRLRVVVGGAVAGIGLVAVSIAVGGWDRIVSPLSYQGDRGLQVESVAATPAMVRWALAPDGHRVFFAPSLAWEVDGPGTDALIVVSTVVTVLLVVVLGGLWLLAWLRLPDPRTGLPAVVWLTLGAIAAFVVSGKVLSPQYLLWLLPAACAGLALLEGRDRQRLLRWSTVLLVATALTHVVFPHGYLELLDHSGWSIVVVAVLAVRNVLLVGLCAWALVAALQAVRRVPRRPRGRVASPAS